MAKSKKKNDGLDAIAYLPPLRWDHSGEVLARGAVGVKMAPVKPDKTPKIKLDDQWVWVTGYKGTDKDMKCRGYQYELGKVHVMPDDEEIQTCLSGFHLCEKLRDVYGYYPIDEGNRFFEVRALVRLKDTTDSYPWNITYGGGGDKFAAKEIVFLRELTVDEIFDAYGGDDVKDFTKADKNLAISRGIRYVYTTKKTKELTMLGYAEKTAKYIVDNGMYEKAAALGHQTDMSMNTRMLILFDCVKGVW